MIETCLVFCIGLQKDFGQRALGRVKVVVDMQHHEDAVGIVDMDHWSIDPDVARTVNAPGNYLADTDLDSAAAGTASPDNASPSLSEPLLPTLSHADQRHSWRHQ